MGAAEVIAVGAVDGVIDGEELMVGVVVDGLQEGVEVDGTSVGELVVGRELGMAVGTMLGD